MGYSPKQLKEMLGEDKAKTLMKSINYDESKHIPGRKKTKIVPDKPYVKYTEYEHGKELHKFLDAEGVKHTHIGNESGQSGTKNIVIMMAKKKASGVSKGYPDYVIYPIVNGKQYTLYIELKKAKGARGGLNGSTISDEQVEWIDFLNKCEGSKAVISHGYKEAIQHYLKFIEEIQL